MGLEGDVVIAVARCVIILKLLQSIEVHDRRDESLCFRRITRNDDQQKE